MAGHASESRQGLIREVRVRFASPSRWRPPIDPVENNLFARVDL